MDKPILINRDLQSSSLVNRSIKRKLVSSPSMHSASAFKLTEMIKNQSNENDQKIDWELIEKFRLKVKKFMSQSSFGLFYENLLLVLSILSCFEYIYSTYLKNYLNNTSPTNYILTIIELSLATVFAVDWLLCFFTADHKVIYCSSFFSMVDLLTVVPIYVTYGKSMPNVMYIHTFNDALIYTMFAMGTTRILRALRVRRKLAKIEDAVERFLAEMCMSIVVMILFFAACIQFVEYPYQIHHYPTWVYMMWVTMSTVGYGDIVPYTTQGRVVIMCIISFSIIIIPKMTNELIEKMKLQTIYARAVYTPLSKKSKHVVICGDISSTSMSEFFDELFHEDHENPDLHAILLLPHPPSIEMILLFTNSKFFLSFLYLEGSALIDNDLKRAKIESAEAIFIMTNKFSLKPDEEDAKTILLSLSIKRYISLFNKSISINAKLYCMQIIRPQNLRHLNGSEDMYNQSVEEFEQLSASKNDTMMDLVVCINEIKMGVLAKGVMYPGANTLLMNLVSSFSDEMDEEEEDEEPNTEGNPSTKTDVVDLPTTNNQYIRSKPWLKEYQKGCGWEIYSTELSPIFEGTKFSELSYALYEKIGVVLFAIQITDKNIQGSTRLLLNPAAFVIPSQQQYDIEAFVIAQNQASSNLSFNQTGQGKKLNYIEKDLSKAVSSMSHTVNSIGESTVHALGGIISNNLNMHTNTSNTNHNYNRSSIVKKEARLSVAKTRTSAYRIVPIERDTKEKSFHNSGSESEKNINQSIKNKPSSSRAKELWKKLKRSSLIKQKVETFSYQEILHKLEDQHWIDNYYLRQKIVTQKSVTIKTNVTDEIPHINHHLIVIGKGLNNLLDLIQPLRSKHLGILKYIVILSMEELPLDMWQRICMFDAIVLVKGSALEEKNLRRAGIFRASQVVVLADGNNEKNLTNSSSSGMSALVDSDAIFTYQCVKRMNPNTQTIVEIVNSSNISYLDTGDLDGNTSEDNYKLSSQFAAGNLFTTTLLDSVVCQAYYNPSIIKVMKKLLSGVDQAESGELEAKAHYKCLEIEDEANHISSKKVSNSKKTDSECDSDDSKSEKEKHSVPTKLQNIPKILRNSINAVNNDENIAISNAMKDDTMNKLQESTLIKSIKGSCLYQMEMTEALGSKTYGEIYLTLSLQGIIPLGLLRGTLADMTLGPKQNRYPYVYTNPDHTTEVFKCDKLFVLSTKPIQALGKVDIKDWLLNIQMEKNKNEAIGAAIASTSTIAKDKRLEHIDLLQKKIDARINKVSHHMKKQLNNLSKVIENCITLSRTDNNHHSNSGMYNTLARRGSIESSTSGGSDIQQQQQASQGLSPNNNNSNIIENMNQYRRSSLESALSNTSALTSNVTIPSEQELQQLKVENNNNNNTINKNDISVNNKVDYSTHGSTNIEKSHMNNNKNKNDSKSILQTNAEENHSQEKGKTTTNTTTILKSERKVINNDISSTDYIQKKTKSTPLKHLLNELNDSKCKGPSIKLVMSPITKKRIQKIRAVSANYNKTTPSDTYRVLSAGKYRESNKDIEEHYHHYPPRSSSYISTEAIYYKQDDYSDEGSLSGSISDNNDLYEEV